MLPNQPNDNNNNEVNPAHQRPAHTTLREIIKRSATYSGPMIGCSFAGLATDFAFSMMVNNLLSPSACVCFAIEYALFEIPLSGWSYGLTTTSANIAKTGARCEGESEGNMPTENWNKIGSHFQHGVIAALIYAALYDIVLLTATRPLLNLVGCQDQYKETIENYTTISTGYIPAYFLSYLFNELGYATKQRKPVAVIQLISGAVGVGVAYAGIQLRDGPDENKLLGVAWGLVARYWTSLFLSMVYYKFIQPRQLFGEHPHTVNFELFKRFHSFSPKYLGKILKEGLYAQLFVETESIVPSVMTSIIQKTNISANIVAMNIATQFLSLMIIPLFVIGSAANIMISDTIGRDRPEDMKRIGYILTLMGIAFELLFMTAFLVMPEILIKIFHSEPSIDDNTPIMNMLMMPGQVMKLFQSNSPIDEHNQIISATTDAIKWICYFQIFDAARLIFGGALRGANDFLINCAASIALLLPVTYFLGDSLSKDPGFEIIGVVLARGIAVALNALITGLWWIYKSRPDNHSKSIGDALMSTGFFNCRKPSTDQENRAKYAEVTQPLLEEAVNINADPDHRKFFPSIDPESQFQHPPRTCLIL